MGNLGTPIARNLIESGYPIRIFNRTRNKVNPLIQLGATGVDTLKELAAISGVVITLVSDDQALQEITTGPEGLLANMQPGSIHISMSTVSPELVKTLTRQHKDAGKIYLAAPIMGRPEAARSRQLTILVAGPGESIREVDPLWQAMGASAVRVFGEEPALANTMKLCVNFLIASSLEALAETYALAERSGINPHDAYELLTSTLFNCIVFKNYGKLMLDATFQKPSFTLKLGLKDINLVLDAAALHHVSMDQGHLIKRRMQESMDKERGEWDWSAITLIAREKMDTERE